MESLQAEVETTESEVAKLAVEIQELASQLAENKDRESRESSPKPSDRISSPFWVLPWSSWSILGLGAKRRSPFYFWVPEGQREKRTVFWGAFAKALWKRL